MRASDLIETASRGYRAVCGALRPVDGVPPLLLRLIVAPVMIEAGWKKLVGFEGTVRWFDRSLGLPLPEAMAALATSAELFGGVLLLIGLGTRFVAVPLMVTMVVAAVSVHWQHGWLAISDANSWFANQRILEAAPRKAEIIDILRQHGDYSHLTARGRVTILNNGIEFAAIYFAMLLSLMYTGGGRFTSVDYFLTKRLGRLGPRREDAREGVTAAQSRQPISKR